MIMSDEDNAAMLRDLVEGHLAEDARKAALGWRSELFKGANCQESSLAERSDGDLAAAYSIFRFSNLARILRRFDRAG